MSVRLDKRPSGFGFLGNREHFEWECNDVVISGAACDMKYFRVDIDEMPIGSCLVLTMNGERYVFTVKTNPTDLYDLWCGRRDTYVDEDGNVVPDPVVMIETSAVEYAVGKMNACYYINELLDVSVHQTQQGTGMRFTGREIGKIVTDLTSEKSNGEEMQGYVNIAINSTYGEDEVKMENYGLMVRVASGHELTDWMIFQPDNDGRVRFTPDIATSFRKELPVPSEDASGFADVSDGVLSYRVEYAECYGSPVRIRAIQRTGSFYALDGRQQEPFRSANMPDWIDPCELSLSDGGNAVRVMADEGAVVTHRVSTPYHIYMMSVNGGEVYGKMTLYNMDGTTSVISIDPYTVRANGLARYTVNLRNYRETTYRYELSFEMGGYEYHCTGNLLPDLYEKHYFLFTDRHGLLMSMDAEKVAMTSVSEGTDVMRGDEHFVSVTDHHNVYTATTMAMSDDEKRLIGEAKRGRECYYLKDGIWQRIALNTGSIEVVTGMDDVDVVAFAFRIVGE